MTTKIEEASTLESLLELFNKHLEHQERIKELEERVHQLESLWEGDGK